MSKKNKLQIVSSSDEVESSVDSKELEKIFKLNECGA